MIIPSTPKRFHNFFSRYGSFFELANVKIFNEYHIFSHSPRCNYYLTRSVLMKLCNCDWDRCLWPLKQKKAELFGPKKQ